jgi:hypothetical protein
MFGSTILEVAIGLIVVFILVGSICSAIREGLEAWLKTRAAYLEHGIRQLLDDAAGTGLAKQIYEHPLIYGMYNGAYTPGKNQVTPSTLAEGKNLPSYITAANFSMALMEIASRGPQGADASQATSAPVTLDAIRQNVSAIGNKKIERVLLQAVNSAQGDINKAQTMLETWFNSGMDRVSGWYKRSTQKILFIIALLVAVGMNINTIKIANYLSHDDAARKIIVEKAGAKDGSNTTLLNYAQADSALNGLDLPIGWTDGGETFFLDKNKDSVWNNGIGPILGLLITALAAMLGAPFWFDILNKVMVLRSTIKPLTTGSAQQPAPQQQQQPAPQQLIVTTQAAAPADTPDDDDKDGCDVQATDLTSDEDLPESKGGTQ